MKVAEVGSKSSNELTMTASSTSSGGGESCPNPEDLSPADSGSDLSWLDDDDRSEADNSDNPLVSPAKPRTGSSKRKKSRVKSPFLRLGKSRRQANARERRRVAKMADAYDSLKRCLPVPAAEIDALSRKAVLEEAIWYMEELERMLNSDAVMTEVDSADIRPSPSVQRMAETMKTRHQLVQARKQRRRERRRAKAAQKRAASLLPYGAASTSSNANSSEARTPINSPGHLFPSDFTAHDGKAKVALSQVDANVYR